MTARPIDVVSAKLAIVHGTPPKLRARCPAHGSNGGTLAVTATSEDVVLLKCHAGCTPSEVLSALGLTLRDLFPSAQAARGHSQERAATRRRYARSPREALQEVLLREHQRLRERLRSEHGYDRPLTSRDLNTVRARACHELGLPVETLAPVPPFAWEGCPPHDTDPLWPTLFARGMDLARLRAVDLNCDGAVRPETLRRFAEEWAARELHQYALRCSDGAA